MEVRYPRCAGLDVHKDSVVACVRIARAGAATPAVQTFGTTTAQLLQLLDWLIEQGCTHAAMEATGVYWKPVWHVLEGHLALVLANAMHVRNVPGRKTDVNDATWLADLQAHGLIRASFVPDAPIQELRDLTRTRKQLVREAARYTLRIQKVLEDANLKITGLITDVMGASGRSIVQALVDGESDPEKLAQRAQGRLRAKHAQLVEALRGRLSAHHRFLLRSHLRLYDALQVEIQEVEGRIGASLEPFRVAEQLLTTIPGVRATAASVILAEIGPDMSRFPTAGHLLSWAGLCPRNDESAGKRRSTRLRPGAPWLKTVLIQAAWAASRTKASYLQSQFLRLKSRRGPKKAIVAVAASMLTAIYHMLRNGVPYRDLGPHHFDRRENHRIAQRLIRRLEALGLRVQVQPAA
jgi:transposase